MRPNLKTLRALMMRGGSILVLAAGIALAPAQATMAEEGGNPAHHVSVFERLAQERARQAEREVVQASAPADRTSWHDKTQEEWRAYHEAERQFWIRNTGR